MNFGRTGKKERFVDVRADSFQIAQAHGKQLINRALIYLDS